VPAAKKSTFLIEPPSQEELAQWRHELEARMPPSTDPCWFWRCAALLALVDGSKK
jgi:hypothetical protein